MGLCLILWGVTLLFDFVPGSVGIAGSGLILLGLNTLRSLNSIPTKSTTTILGIFALAWGGLELACSLLRPTFELSGWTIFAILLIMFGGIKVVHELLRIHIPDIENVH